MRATVGPSGPGAAVAAQQLSCMARLARPAVPGTGSCPWPRGGMTTFTHDGTLREFLVPALVVNRYSRSLYADDDEAGEATS